MKKLIILIFVFLASGCVEYRWDKPGASEHDLAVDKTACRAEALKVLPPDNMITGTQTDAHKSRDKRHRAEQFNIEVRDLNDDKRKVLVTDCMYRRGWSIIETRI